MLYVVGLGNPGDAYTKTRHNVGWMTLDNLQTSCTCADPDQVNHWQAMVVRCVVGTETELMLVYPQTFMNRSGETVRQLLHDQPAASLVIVHDDIALPVGKIRISQGKGHGGHNGIKSIFEHTKRTDFVRVRIGIASTRWWSQEPYVPTGAALPKHVLSGFAWWERSAIQSGIDRATQAVLALGAQDIAIVMNTYNTDVS